MTKQTTTLDFDVEGMTCASCAARIEKALVKQPGVEAATVNLAAARARVRTVPSVDEQSLKDAVAKIGYELRTKEADHAAGIHSTEETRQWRRFWIAAALTMPALVLAMFTEMNATSAWLLLALTTPVVLWIGSQFHRIAWK